MSHAMAGDEMTRTIAAIFVILLLAVPSHAKTKELHSVKGIYPVSCDDLWSAVKETLRNHDNYGLGSLNDLDLRASFVVIGDLWVQTNRVALIEKGNGCEMKADVADIGAENTNYRQFRGRVQRALARMLSAKERTPPEPGGQPKSEVGPQHQ